MSNSCPKSLPLASLAEEFYEEGLCNILNLIPTNLDDEERLLIESVVFAGYGYYRAYNRVEQLIDSNTTDNGEYSRTYANIRDAFQLCWTIVDNAYTMDSLSKTRTGQRILTLSSETKSNLSDAAILRNYMDHISSNFRNAATAKNHAPLFGWISYQFTPHLRDSSFSDRVIYLTNVGSSHLKESYTFDASRNSSTSVLSAIDNITLHTRRNDRFNATRTFAKLTLDLNEFSQQTQMRIFGRLQDPTFNHGGLREPFPQVVAKGDLETAISTLEFAKHLEQNKVRATIQKD